MCNICSHFQVWSLCHRKWKSVSNFYIKCITFGTILLRYVPKITKKLNRPVTIGRQFVLSTMQISKIDSETWNDMALGRYSKHLTNRTVIRDGYPARKFQIEVFTRNAKLYISFHLQSQLLFILIINDWW